MSKEEFCSCYQIEGNLNRPTVELNALTGQLIFSGRSILENTVVFYNPILEWFNTYLESPAEQTELHMKLEYFNTSTSKYILDIIDKLSTAYNEGVEISVIWYYSDEDMAELGDDYMNMLDIPFQFIEMEM